MILAGDYKEKFREETAKLIALKLDDPIERLRKSNELIESYITETGERPDVREVDDLSSYIIFGYKGVSVLKKTEAKRWVQ
ncbi:MAG: hypothetical protein IRZ03_18270 [Acidobacterium ailaaui]|nr:hypothetical protein [Pseudacidobacterium ailaaui]